MKKLIVILVLAATTVFAGAIVQGHCGECGYTGDEIFWGRGMDPGGVALIYRDPATGDFNVVRFSFVLRHGDEAGLDLDEERDWFEYKEDHLDEIMELDNGFEAPDLLGELAVDGALPGWVLISDEDADGALEWKYVDDPLGGDHECPFCGEEEFEFEQVGWWD